MVVCACLNPSSYCPPCAGLPSAAADPSTCPRPPMALGHPEPYGSLSGPFRSWLNMLWEPRPVPLLHTAQSGRPCSPCSAFQEGAHVDASDPSLSMSPLASDLVLLVVDKSSVKQYQTWREVFGARAHFILFVYDDLDVSTLPDVDSAIVVRARSQVR
jgi:hypothetical protein